MDFAEIINKSKFVLPSHRKDLIKVLSDHFPDGVDKILYARNVDAYNLYQGDIVVDIPVCFINAEGLVLRGLDTVALISNSCDMQPGRRSTVIVSPIIKLADLELQANVIDEIKRNNIFRYFYLPSKGSFPESCVDLSKMVSVSSSYINHQKQNDSVKFVLSLSDPGFYLFLIKLTYHLARTEDQE